MVLIWFIVLFLVLLIYKATRKPKNFPPGPPRLPVVGSLPYMGVQSKPSEPKSLLTGIRNGIKNVKYMNGYNYINADIVKIFAQALKIYFQLLTDMEKLLVST